MLDSFHHLPCSSTCSLSQDLFAEFSNPETRSHPSISAVLCTPSAEANCSSSCSSSLVDSVSSALSKLWFLPHQLPTATAGHHLSLSQLQFLCLKAFNMPTTLGKVHSLHMVYNSCCIFLVPLYLSVPFLMELCLFILSVSSAGKLAVPW